MKASYRARRMARNHGRLKAVPKLNLVSLMDIFTILVFFLMVNSGEVEVLQSDKTLVLPDSVSEQKPDAELLVKINDRHLMLQGKVIGTIADIEADTSPYIEQLVAELEIQAGSEEIPDELLEQGLPITIMGDKSVPYALLKKVMASCAQTDFRDISLAVNSISNQQEDADSTVTVQ